MNALLETAYYWQKSGVSVLPIRYMDKHPDARLLPKDEQGDPTWKPYQKRLPTDEELERWFMGSLHNIGLITGWQNLVVLDFDEVDEYVTWSMWATRTGGYTRRIMEMTYIVQTARGMHVYLRSKQQEQNRHIGKIDIKARNGYVLIPPSVHPTGIEYKVYQKGIPAVIESLSEILPASYLVKNIELPPAVTAPAQAAQRALHADDPWAAAEQPPDPDKDLVTQVRANYRIEQFFTDLVDTSSDGRWKMAPCPFHDDKHPSFWLDTQRGICGCFAGCTPKPLDVINLYARLHGISNREAIFYLANL